MPYIPLTLNKKKSTIHVKKCLFYPCFSVYLCRDISETAISSLPDNIISGLKKLLAESAYHLKILPPPQQFAKLRLAKLTYPSHCCAFKNKPRSRYRCLDKRTVFFFFRENILGTISLQTVTICCFKMFPLVAQL